MKVQKNYPKKMFMGGAAFGKDFFANLIARQNANKQANQPVPMAKPMSNLQFSPFETPTSSGVMPAIPGLSNIAVTQASGNPMLGVAQTLAKRSQAARSGANPVPVAAGGGAYKVNKYRKGGLSPAQSKHMDRNNDGSITAADFKLMEHGGVHGDPPGILQKLVEMIKGGRPFRKEMQGLENEAFEEQAAREAQRYEDRFGEGGTREERLRDKALQRSIKDFYGVSSDPTQTISSREIMKNPEEYSEMLDKIPDEVYQKHFGKLWDRSEFFRKLFFKSPERSEQGLPQEAIDAMGKAMASGAGMM
tara:strand:- start:897 stop:1811 length:915 start_codon:yes stop_codon:yes gene_type:complete